jgi:hypothetical protein
MTRPAVRPWHPDGRLCCRSQPRDFPPDLESVPHLLAIHWGREPVAPRSEVLGNGTIRREKPLGVPWGLEPLHAPLPLARGLVGVFRAVVQVPVLAVLHAG